MRKQDRKTHGEEGFEPPWLHVLQKRTACVSEKREDVGSYVRVKGSDPVKRKEGKEGWAPRSDVGPIQEKRGRPFERI